MDSRTLGRLKRYGAYLGAVLVLSVGPTVRPSWAQVGHDPARSPYRDFRRTSGISFMSGWMLGDRGRLKIGHTNGQTYTFGFEVPIGGTLSFHPSVTYAQTERYVIDPFLNVDQRLSGPVPDDMSFIDLGLRAMLTGNKTWHGLAMYASGGLGMAVSMGGPRDRGPPGPGTAGRWDRQTGRARRPGRRQSVLAVRRSDCPSIRALY